jgi:integrase
MPKVEVPRHRHHKASGLGFVVLSSVQHYTGRWGTVQSRAEYDRLLTRWIAGGRRPLAGPRGGATVADVLDLHERMVATECRKRGRPTKHALRVAWAARPARAMFGTTMAAEFGLAELEAVRGYWLGYRTAQGRPICRSSVEALTRCVAAAFRRAARPRHALVPAERAAALSLLGPLGRGEAPQRPKVGPAPSAAVAAVLGAVRDATAGMIRLQLATGMRPAEVCALRRAHLHGRADGVWEYRVPAEWNKTAHHGGDRVVYLGPRAMEIVRPYLDRVRRDDEPVFRTRCGHAYSPSVYGNLVRKVCDRLGVQRWSPNQLRHSRLTEVDEALGLEAAAAVGGHAGVETTRGYTERARETLAARVAREMG